VKLRVLHVIQSVAQNYGGPSAAVLGMCRAVSACDVDAEIYATNVDVGGRLDVPLLEPTVVDHVQVTFFPVHGPKRRFRFSLPLAQSLLRNVRRFDLVHIHSLYNFPALVAAHCCRYFRVPYLVRPHGTLDPYHYRQRRLVKAPYEALFERRNLVRAAAVHFTSKEEMRLAQLTGWRFKGVVVPLGIDLPPDNPNLRAAIESRWPECRGRRVILFLGRIDEKKGLNLLIPAAAHLMQSRPDLHLLIAGPENDGYGRRVRGWVRDHGIEARVSFTGMLTGEAKRCAFGAASLFVLPSRSENFGVAVAEAMAAGVPVLVSEHVNIAPQIVAANAGVAVPLRVKALQTEMATLLDNPHAAAVMGSNARAWAQAQLSWCLVGEKLANLYKAVAATEADGRWRRETNAVKWSGGNDTRGRGCA
jgi:glycosyltransferase involved in cell wall biosynthesis